MKEGSEWPNQSRMLCIETEGSTLGVVAVVVAAVVSVVLVVAVDEACPVSANLE
jgi:hypothetical protein